MTVSASVPAAGGGAQAISPSDEALTPAVKELREAHPALGVPKLLAQLKSSRPEWLVSEKRLRKVLASLASPPSREVSTGAEATGGDASKADLVAATGLDPSIDVGAIAPKVKVKMFGHGKGKGLVAREKILQGEVVWQEEPWIVTADPCVSFLPWRSEDNALTLQTTLPTAVVPADVRDMLHNLLPPLPTAQRVVPELRYGTLLQPPLLVQVQGQCGAPLPSLSGSESARSRALAIYPPARCATTRCHLAHCRSLARRARFWRQGKSRRD